MAWVGAGLAAYSCGGSRGLAAVLPAAIGTAARRKAQPRADRALAITAASRVPVSALAGHRRM